MNPFKPTFITKKPSSVTLFQESGAKSCPVIPSLAKHQTYEDYLDYHNGRSFKHYEKDTARRNLTKRNERIIFSKLMYGGIDTRKKHEKWCFFEDAKGSGSFKYKYFKKYRLGQDNWMDLERNHLYMRVQQEKKQRIIREMLYYYQQKASRYKHYFITFTPEGFVDPIDTGAAAQELKSAIGTRAKNLRAKHGINLLFQSLHFDPKYRKVDDVETFTTRPHSHAMIEVDGGLTKAQRKAIEASWGTIAHVHIDPKPIKSTKAVVTYCQRVEDYSEFTVDQLEDLYDAFKGLRTYEYYSSLKKEKAAWKKDKVTPRYKHGRYILTDLPPQFADEDKPEDSEEESCDDEPMLKVDYELNDETIRGFLQDTVESMITKVCELITVKRSGRCLVRDTLTYTETVTDKEFLIIRKSDDTDEGDSSDKKPTFQKVKDINYDDVSDREKYAISSITPISRNVTREDLKELESLLNYLPCYKGLPFLVKFDIEKYLKELFRAYIWDDVQSIRHSTLRQYFFEMVKEHLPESSFNMVYIDRVAKHIAEWMNDFRLQMVVSGISAA